MIKKIKKSNFGYLKILVLLELYKEKSTGYDLMKKLKSTLKKTPSPGSIYPILSELLFNRQISVKIDGRKKIYSLTKKGEKEINFLLLEKEKSLIDNFKLMVYFNQLLTKPCFDKAEKLKNEMLKNPKLISSYLKDWDELKLLAIDLLLEKDYYKKQNEIKLIIKNTILKLKEIKKK
jgi:DNA-binding PadR family transcriptional regulator